VSKELLAHAGDSLVLVGPEHAPLVHAIAHRWNTLLGNTGRTVHYLREPATDEVSALDSISELARELAQDKVDTLFVLGNNPVYSAPGDLDLANLLGRAKRVWHAGLYADETAELAQWHLPLAHTLESWSDGRAQDGTLTLGQPLIEPLHGARSELELLALLLGSPSSKGQDLVRATHAPKLTDPVRWRRAVHDGFVLGTEWPRLDPELRPLPQLEPGAPSGLELTFCPDYRLYDGRFSNLPILQELPDPISRASWGNVAVMAPQTMARLGLSDGDEVRLGLGGRSLSLPVIGVLGQALDSVRVTLGHGRWRAGRTGGSLGAGVIPVGANAGSLRTRNAFFFATGLSVSASGRRLKVTTPLPRIRHHAGQEKLLGEALPPLGHEVTWEAYARPSGAQQQKGKARGQQPSATGPRWGMVADLGRCIGCQACVVACRVENNVPAVGASELERGRELDWLRIDRHCSGTDAAPRWVWQPLMCQHCEAAPCEQVCPVGATLHTSEGLNDMVYSRCVGARLCANNCPYQVRRFNYFEHAPDPRAPDYELVRLALNPEVTVRSRGVMEKCTFCVQRIQAAKFRARQAGRSVLDGEIRTACQQACPTGALVFGDLSDPESTAAKLAALPRSHALLAELGTRPRVRYLSRVIHGRS
jgi:molybdopterin-containing oxidoreductase family iron-sulfur binding subunit